MNQAFPPLSLTQALRIGLSPRIAFTGAGGKTTAIFMLARELLAGGMRRVFVTTTTHLSVVQAHQGHGHIEAARPADLVPASAVGLIVVTSGRIAGKRVGGISEEVLLALRILADENGAALLIEADGSRMRALKAPAAHEPVIPDFVDLVVVTAGLGALGRLLSEENVHRPEIFAKLSRLSSGDVISPQGLVDVLRHPEGGLKGIPAGVRRVLLLNQADSDVRLAQAVRVAEALQGVYDGAVIAALDSAQPVRSVQEPVGAVILAAGASRRMGSAKQLLDWRGKSLVTHAVETALAAGCSPVIVVTGADGEAVGREVAALPVWRVQNDEWAAGQSTSVQAGLRALPARTGAAVFMLIDQPFVGPALVRALIEAHAGSLAPIVAPLIDGQRGNPVLFDRTTFPDFAHLTGDMGARPLFARHRALWVPWHDARALRDLDTPSEYEETLRRDAGGGSGDEEA